MKPSLFLLDHFGFIKISGKDATTFLQGQLTADINSLTSTHSSLCARCTPQGRVVSLFRIFHYGDAYFLRLPHSMINITIESLKKFALFSKAVIEDKSQELVAVGLHYPQESNINLPLPASCDNSIANEEGYLTRVPGEERFEYYIEQSKFYAKWEKLKSQCELLPTTNWHQMDIAQGIPDIYPQTTEIFTAHDLNLPALNAVSFTKGCYSGQEIVARTHYRATLKQHLYHAETMADVSLNMPILHEGKTVGHIVTFVKSDTALATCLALLRDEAIEQNLTVNDSALMLLPLHYTHQT